VTLTAIAIEGQIVNPDGSTPTGSLSATLNAPLINGTQVIPAGAIAGLLNSEGQIVAASMDALVLWATDDAGTEPTGPDGIPMYTFSLSVDGSPLREFSAPVPSASTATETNGGSVDGSATVALDTLVASESMVGQEINGTNLPGGTRVQSVNAAANTLTLTQVATATSLGECVWVIGGAVAFSALIPAAL
jgi:hypothetical protein